MAITIGNLLVKLGLDSKEFDTGMDQALGKSQKAGRGMVDNLSKVGGAVVMGALAAGVVGVAAVGGALVKSTKAAADWEVAVGKLDAVQESMGQASGFTTKQLLDHASALQSVTRHSDDTIVAGQAILATFGEISGDIFMRATEVGLDLAEVFGTSVPGAAVMLGKALNDPIRGMAALTRVGVAFTDQEREMITALQESGDMLGAQTVMLEALEKQVGGAARAVGETFVGRLAQAQNALGDIQKEIGAAVLPTVTKLAEAFSAWLSDPAVQEGIASIVEGIANLGITVVEAIPKVIEWFEGVARWFMENEGVIIGILAALGVAVAAFVYTTVIPAAIAMIGAMLPILLPLAAIAAAVYLLYEAWQTNFLGIRDIVDSVIAFITPLIAGALAWLTDLWETHSEVILGLASNAWMWIQQAVDDALDWIQAAVADVLAWVDAFWQSHGETIMGIAETAWDGISKHVETALQFIQAIIDTVMAIIRGDWEGAWEGIHSIADTYLAMIQNLVDTILGIVAGIFGLNAAELKAITDDAWTAIYRTIDTMINAVKTVIEVIVAAIEAFWQTHGDTILRIADLAWEAIMNTIDTITKLIYGIYEAFRALFEGDFQGFMTAVLQLWVDLWEGIMRNLGIFGEALRLALGILWDQIVVGVTQMFRGFLRVVEEWLPKILKIFTETWERIKEGAMNTINSVKSSFQNVDWPAIGRAIIDGIARGIKAGAQAVIDAASSAARAAFEAAKRVLGIGSPSKLFWEIGENLSISMAGGIDRMVRQVESAATNLGNIASQGVQSHIPTAPTMRAPAAAPAAGNSPIYNYYLTNTFGQPDDPRRIEHVIRALEATHA